MPDLRCEKRRRIVCQLPEYSPAAEHGCASCAMQRCCPACSLSEPQPLSNAATSRSVSAAAAARIGFLFPFFISLPLASCFTVSPRPSPAPCDERHHIRDGTFPAQVGKKGVAQIRHDVFPPHTERRRNAAFDDEVPAAVAVAGFGRLPALALEQRGIVHNADDVVVRRQQIVLAAQLAPGDARIIVPAGEIIDMRNRTPEAQSLGRRQIPSDLCFSGG